MNVYFFSSKLTGKMFLRKCASRLCRYSVGQNFCQKCSISHSLRDKCVFAFYAEIQDGRHKLQKNNFRLNVPVDSAVTSLKWFYLAVFPR